MGEGFIEGSLFSWGAVLRVMVHWRQWMHGRAVYKSWRHLAAIRVWL